MSLDRVGPKGGQRQGNQLAIKVNDKTNTVLLEHILIELRKMTIMLSEMSGIDVDTIDIDTEDEM